MAPPVRGKSARFATTNKDRSVECSGLLRARDRGVVLERLQAGVLHLNPHLHEGLDGGPPPSDDMDGIIWSQLEAAGIPIRSPHCVRAWSDVAAAKRHLRSPTSRCDQVGSMAIGCGPLGTGQSGLVALGRAH